MKTALCYSGQVGAFRKAVDEQERAFLNDCDDIYAYTSNIVTHKTHNHNWLNPIDGKVHRYLHGGEGWRKNLPDYGVVYKVSDSTVEQELKLLKNKLVKYHILNESLEDTLNDSNMSKWEWLKKRQLLKMFEANEMLKDSDEEYDIVVRCRFEFAPNLNIQIKEIFEKHGGPGKIFIFGGWPCVQPMVFMDEMMCDGFAFGCPKTMNVFSSLYLKEEPYPYDPKYKECWDKFGDNVEYQLRTHLEKNDIEIIYLGNQRNFFHLYR